MAKVRTRITADGIADGAISTEKLSAAVVSAMVGISGPTGPAGAPGPTGPSGPKGAAGILVGFEAPEDPNILWIDVSGDGENSIVGATGPTGPTGASGPTGPAPLVEPHETDVNKIYVGGVEVYAAQGATGPTGPTGEIGPTGAVGETGVIGATGETGPTGVAGPTGVTGPGGATGPIGVTGATGVIGATGTAGAIGATGVAGVTGPIGVTGATGPVGITGATGPGLSANIIVPNTSGTIALRNDQGQGNIVASDITEGTINIARLPLGSTSATICIGNDARLSDTRTPSDTSVSTAKIVNNAVTYAKLQNISADRLLGRASSSAGEAQEITCTSFARTILDDANADAARDTIVAPSRTGGGASGTWGISITGNAATATTATNHTSGAPNNTDNYQNARVIRNSNTSSANDGMHIGYGNSNFGLTRIYGGGSTLTHIYLGADANLHRSDGVRYVLNSGTWAINVTGSAGSLSGFGNPTTAATGNTIVYRDGSGDSTFRYVHSQFLNMSHGAGNRTADTIFYSSTDDYLRKNTAAGMRSSLSVPTRTGGDASGTWNINVNGDITKTAPTIGYTVNAAAMSYGGHAGPQILSVGGGAAAMSFHRPGAYAVNFGLDTDNQLKVGGWSLGANSYVILTSGNYNTYAPTKTGGGASGTWGINVTGFANAETLATVCSRGGGTTNGQAITTNGFTCYGHDGNSNATHWFYKWGYQAPGAWTYPYPDLIVGYHTGIKIGANINYGGVRFYQDHPGFNATELMAVGKYNNDVYVNYNLGVGGSGNIAGSLNTGSGITAGGPVTGRGNTVVAGNFIGGWGQFGSTVELRTEGNGAQDGPRLWYHKGNAKFWAAGIQPYGAHGYAIWEDGFTGGWGTERFRIDPGGQLWHNSVPAFNVRAWAVFDGSTSGSSIPTLASGNVASVTRTPGYATGAYRITFSTWMPHRNYAIIGTSSNQSIDCTGRVLLKIGNRETHSFDFRSCAVTTVNSPANSTWICVAVIC